MEEELNITNIVNNEMQPIEPIVQMQQNLQQQAKAKESGATSLYDSLKVPYFGGTGVQAQASKPSIEYQVPIEEGYNLVGEEYISKYPTYEAGRDNAEYAAQTQSTFDKWTNGLTKAGANLLTTIAGNTVGFVVGAAEGASQGNWNAVFDNGFSNMLADYNDKLNYQLPNYVSKDEQDDNFFESMGTANFWAKDVAGGFSFTLGTIVSEAIWATATGGIVNSAKWGLQGAKLANKLRWGKAALGAEETAVGLANYKKFVADGVNKLYQTGKIEATTAKLFASTAKTLNTARFLATSSGNEAGIEALQYKREQTENFYRDFEKLNGRDPNEQEIAEFNDNLEASANAVFATNMAILAPSNIAMFGSLFNITSPTRGISKAMNKSLFGVGVEKTVGESAEVAYKGLQATGRQKVAQYTYAALKPLATEGLWEEGLQGVTTKSAENWITSTYDPKYNNKTLALSDATYQAFADQYGTKEGWKEIGIGAIIGIGSSMVIGRGKFQEVREFERAQRYQEEYVAPMLNQFGDQSALATDSIVRKMMFDARVANAVEVQKEATDKGDDVSAAIAQQDFSVAEMQFRTAMGEDLSTLTSKYETAMNAVPDADFEARGISDIEGYKEATIGAYKNLVKSYERASDFADAVLGDSKILGQDISTQHLKDALTASIVRGEKANLVMNEIAQSMGQIIGDDSIKIMQIQTELQKMGKNKQQQVRRVNNSISQAEQEVKTLSRELQRLQVSKDEEKGARLQKVQEKLTDATEKVVTLKAEREELAKQVSQESKRRRSISGTNLSDVNLATEFISGNDLADIDNKLQKIEDSIKSYEGVNHEIYYDLLDLKRQYVTAKEHFFSYQDSVDAIIRGDFAPKFAKMSGLLGQVFQGKDKPIDNFTNKFLAQTWENYTKSGARMDAEALLKDMISDEDYAVFKENGDVSEEVLTKLAEKVRIKDILTEREREIYDAKTQEINALTQPNPNKPDLRVETVAERELKALEAEKIVLEQLLNEETVDAENSELISKETKKEVLKNQIEALPDDYYITHITSDENAVNIFNSSLSMPAGVSSTTGIVSKEKLLAALNDLLDGKSPHRGYFDMFIGSISKDTLDSQTGKTLQDKLENYIDSNFIESAEKQELPSALNFGYFTNGELNEVNPEIKILRDQLKNTPRYITQISNSEERIKRLKEYITEMENKLENLRGGLSKDNSDSATDINVDAFAKENNNDNLEYEEVNFGANTAVVYQTVNDDSWAGKGSSFRSTWNVLKFNQGTFSHVRILTTPSQKQNYSDDKDSEFSKNLRALAKKYRNSNTVVLIDIRPKNERVQGADRGDILSGIEFYTQEIEDTLDKIEEIEESSSVEINPKYTEIKNKLEALKNTVKKPERAEDKLNTELKKKLDSVNKKILKLRQQNGTLSDEEQLRQEIEQAFKKDYPMLTQDVDEMLKEKPTEQEIKRYQELYKKQETFTEKERNEFEELQPRMQRWFMAQSLPVRGATIADLVEILSQLETTLDREETLTEIDSDALIQETAESKDASSMQRQDILQNMSGNAVTKIADNDVYFYHIEAKTLIDKLVPTVNSATIQTVNDKNKLSKAQDLTPSLLAENSKKEGTIFTIGDTKITIGKRGSVVMSLEDYNKTKDILNLYYFDSNSGKWSYADLYERLDDGTTRKKESEFNSNTISDYLYEAEEGDSLNLFVDMKTDWNRNLIYQALEEIDNKGEISEELKKTIQDKLEITSRKDYNNNSTLKAAYDTVTDDNFIYVRKKYADAFIQLLETEQALVTLPSKINLEAEVSVKDMFLGTPNFQLDENLKPKELPITERGAETVITQGYVQGNEMVLGNKTLDTEKVSRLYVTNIARVNPELKIPVVILQKGAYQFAFPVSMVKTQEDKSDQLEAILVAVETPTEVVKLVNNLMISLGLNTRITKVTPEIIDNIRAELTNYTTFKTADELADVNYNKNQLVADATIKVDLENEVISSPKVTVDYSTLTIGKLDEVETDASKLRQEVVEDLREIEKLVNSSVEIPDKNRLIEAFDNNAVENRGTDIMNRKDINFIKEYFFTTDGKLKTVQGKAVETIGKDKLLALRDKLQLLQFYEAQIRTIKDKNTEKNLNCN